MKKLLSKITSTVITAILLTTSTNVFAMQKNNVNLINENDTIPYAIVCGCGGSYNGQSTQYSPWDRDGYVKCPQNDYFTCLRFSRTKTITYRCWRCDDTYSKKTKEYKYTHSH